MAISKVPVICNFFRRFVSSARENSVRTYGKIHVPSREERCWSLAIISIYKAALKKQLAHVHQEERGRQARESKDN